MSRVGVIGVGNMGLGVALRLRDRGHEVVVRDIDPAREALALAGGCHVAASPAAVAREADWLVVVVVDAAQTEAVLFGPDGAAQALAPGAGVLLCPTIAPADVERFAAALAARGLHALDTPMSGGPVRAREGHMSLMVAAPEPAFAAARPLLQDMADPVFHVGMRPGDGARTKLVNNLLAAVNLVGASEALALAQRLGLDPSTTLDVIERSSGQSWIGVHRLRRALAGDDAVQAHVTLLAKDSALAVAEARGCGAAVPVGLEAAASFARALADGLAGADDSALYGWLLRANEPPR